MDFTYNLYTLIMYYLITKKLFPTLLSFCLITSSMPALALSPSGITEEDSTVWHIADDIEVAPASNFAASSHIAKKEEIIKFKKRLIDKFYIFDDDLPKFNRNLNNVIDRYGFDKILELKKLDSYLLKDIIFKRKTRSLLYRFGIDTFFKIAKIKLIDPGTVMRYTYTLTEPKTAEELISYAGSMKQVYKNTKDIRITQDGEHIKIFKHIIKKHGVDVFIGLTKTAGSSLIYFFEYTQGYEEVHNVEMMSLLNRIKGSKEDVLDFIEILNFTGKKYDYDTSRFYSRNSIFEEKSLLKNLLLLLKGRKPAKVLEFFKLMGVNSTYDLLRWPEEYFYEVLEERGLEIFIDIARKAGKRGSEWHRAFDSNLKYSKAIDEFGFDILLQIAEKSRSATRSMLEHGIPLAMSYIEKDRKNRKEKFLRYAKAVAEKLPRSGYYNEKLIIANKTYKSMVTRKGKTPETIAKELSAWTSFLAKMTRTSNTQDTLDKLENVEDMIKTHGRRPFLKIAREYKGRVVPILNGIYILKEFIKSKEDINYYAAKLNKLLNTPGVRKEIVDSLRNSIPFIKKYDIDHILEIAVALKDNAGQVFSQSLPKVTKLLKTEEDYKRLLSCLKKLKKSCKKEPWHIFDYGIPNIAYLLKSIDDLEHYTPALIEIKNASGNYGLEVMCGISYFKKKIHSKQDLLYYMLPVAKICQYSGDHAWSIITNYMVKGFRKNPEIFRDICDVIDTKIPDSRPAVFKRYASNSVILISLCEKLGIDGLELTEYLLKKNNSVLLSELAEYINIAGKFDENTNKIAGFIDSLPNQNQKCELLRRFLNNIEIFFLRDQNGHREETAHSKDTLRFIRGIDEILAQSKKDILLNVFSMKIKRFDYIMHSLPLDDRNRGLLKRRLKQRKLFGIYSEIIKHSMRRNPDFNAIWALIKYYNSETQSVMESIKKSPQFKKINERIGYLNRRTGELRKHIESSRKKENTKRRFILEDELKALISELKELNQTVKNINRIKDTFKIPLQRLINRHRYSPDPAKYKEELRNIVLSSRIQFIYAYMIGIRNHVYETILDTPILNEVDVGPMVDRIANIVYSRNESGQIYRALTELLRLYIKKKDPDAIKQYIYTKHAQSSLRSARYDLDPIMNGCSLKKKVSTASDVKDRKTRRINAQFEEFFEHMDGLGIDTESIMMNLNIKQPGTYDEAKAIYEAFLELLGKEHDDITEFENILLDIRQHVHAIKSLEAEIIKRQESEQVEYYISLDPVEKMHMGAGFSSCMNIEKNFKLIHPLAIGLSWDKQIAYVKNSKGNRIARRILILTDKCIIVYNEFFNTQLDLDEGWVEFLQKLADATGKTVIIPNVGEISSSFLETVKKHGAKPVKNFKCELLQDEYRSYFRSDLAIKKIDSKITIKSGYKIIPNKQVKSGAVQASGKKTPATGKHFRFLTDPLYRAALVNSMSSIIVKAHELNIKTVFANGISAEPAAQFFSYCWKRLYTDEPVPKVKFLGDAAGQEAKDRYSTVGVKKAITKSVKNSDMLQHPILLIDDVYFKGETLNRTKKILMDDFNAGEVYTAALFRWAGIHGKLPDNTVIHPDIPALNIKPNIYFLTSNWYNTRLHTIRPENTTGEYSVPHSKLQRIFNEDLPHDLRLLSDKVYMHLGYNFKRPTVHNTGPSVSYIRKFVRRAVINSQ